MRRLPRGLALALMAAAVASSAACKQTTPAAGGDGGAAARAGSDVNAEVLARVGDRTITVGDYVAALEHMDQFDRMRYQAPQRREELLGEMIDIYLLADYARQKGYDHDPLVEQETREILRDSLLQEARAGVPDPKSVPDDETRAYYDQHRADFRDPERRRISAIVLSSAREASAVLEAAKTATALQWGELVRTKSTDPRARSGAPADLAGDQGFVSPPDDPRGATSLPAPVVQAAFEIASVGQVLPRVVAAGPSFYVVKWTSRAEARERSFDEAKRAIQVKLTQERIRAKEDALVESLRAKYPVAIDEAALAQVKVDLTADGGT